MYVHVHVVCQCIMYLVLCTCVHYSHVFLYTANSKMVGLFQKLTDHTLHPYCFLVSIHQVTNDHHMTMDYDHANVISQEINLLGLLIFDRHSNNGHPSNTLLLDQDQQYCCYYYCYCYCCCCYYYYYYYYYGDDDGNGGGGGRIFPEHLSPILHAPGDNISHKDNPSLRPCLSAPRYVYFVQPIIYIMQTGMHNVMCIITLHIYQCVDVVGTVLDV